MNEIEDLSGAELPAPAPTAKKQSRAAALLEAAKRRIAAAGSAVAAEAGPFLKDFGQGVGRGLVNLLPDPEDARFVAQQAGAFTGASPFEAAISGSLVRGPLAARGVRNAEQKAQVDAALRMLGIKQRGTAAELRALLAPGGKGGTYEDPVTGEKIEIPAQPGRIETAEAIGRGQAGLVGPKAKAEASAKDPFERAKEERAAARAAAQKSADDAQNAVAQFRKDFEAKMKDSASGSKTQAAFIALWKAELRRNKVLKDAGRQPLPLTLDAQPANSVLRQAVQLEIERVKASRGAK